MARVLVVDDDEACRLTVGRILEAAGHQPSYATDGARGLAAYDPLKFDLVITDLVMPVKSGLVMIQEMCEAHQDPCIIAISGWSPEQLPTAVDYGARCALSKPMTPEELMQAVDSVLDLHDAWDRPCF